MSKQTVKRKEKQASPPVFATSADAATWQEGNCCICKHYDVDSAEATQCAFGNRIALGVFGGAPSAAEAVRFGGKDFYNNCCQKEEREGGCG